MNISMYIAHFLFMCVCYNYTGFACFYLKIKCELLLILHTFHIPTFKFIPKEGKKA